MGRRVLFIQHAGGLGGSAYSLLYTMQGLRAAGDECAVLLARPTDDLTELYTSDGFEVITNGGFALIDHSTVALRPLWKLGTYTELYRAWAESSSLASRLAAIVASTRCDLIHLNSMPLVPVAHALNTMGSPYAWHVREPPPDQGLRTRLMRQVMQQCKGMIFLSCYDRRQWMGEDSGTVVNNFVPDHFFHPDVDREAVRRSLGVMEDQVLTLFLGGSHPAKGGDVVIQAMNSPQLNGQPVSWLIPNATPAPPQRLIAKLGRTVLGAFGSGPRSVRFHNKLIRAARKSVIHMEGFRQGVLPYFVASDIVLFPATLPHFARPVIEAAAVGRPTVASRVGGVDELVEEGTTGMLVPPGDSAALASAICRLVTDPPLRHRLGQAGKILAAERFHAARQIRCIRDVHDTVCGSNRSLQAFQ